MFHGWYHKKLSEAYKENLFLQLFCKSKFQNVTKDSSKITDIQLTIPEESWLWLLLEITGLLKQTKTT